jgi:hypothetical protein
MATLKNALAPMFTGVAAVAESCAGELARVLADRDGMVRLHAVGGTAATAATVCQRERASPEASGVGPAAARWVVTRVRSAFPAVGTPRDQRPTAEARPRGHGQSSTGRRASISAASRAGSREEAQRLARATNLASASMSSHVRERSSIRPFSSGERRAWASASSQRPNSGSASDSFIFRSSHSRRRTRLGAHWVHTPLRATLRPVWKPAD